MTYNYNLGVKQDKNLLAIVFTTLLAVILVGLVFSARADAAGGFDQYGYNDKARVFVGDADGVDRLDDGKIWGSNEVYADDHLVMKWNKAWDDCNDFGGQNDATYCAGAWTTNQWNGMNPDGSQTIYSYKMIWVGSEGEESPYWKEGGYPIWDNYEVIFEKGTGMETIKAVAPGLGQKNLE